MLDLDWITPALGVGGEVPATAFELLAREHGVEAVIDVRAEACDDTAQCRVHGITLLRLPTEDHCAIAPRQIERGVEFAAARIACGQRVLIHCQHGIGRSPLLALCVLVELGLSPVGALALAKARRARVSPSPPQYEAWAAWLRGRGERPPSFDEFAAIAYRSA